VDVLVFIFVMPVRIMLLWMASHSLQDASRRIEFLAAMPFQYMKSWFFELNSVNT